MQKLQIALLALLAAGCNTPPDPAFGPGLLSVDAMTRISNATDRMQDTGPFLKLSPPQLHAVLGPPDKIQHSDFGYENHHYYRDNIDFEFSFRGKDMVSCGYSPTTIFSSPSMNETNYVPTNPFKDHKATDIAYIVFTGSSSPVHGPHFVTRSRDTIDMLFGLLTTVTNEERLIQMCGQLTNIQFFNSSEQLVVGFSVNGDGYTVGTYSGAGYYDKSLVSGRRDIALACFDLMKRNCPEVLLEMKSSADKCVREAILPNFPFDEVK